MTDNQPTDRPEAFPGGAAPDSGGSPLGDLYGAGGAAATPATATPGSGSTASTGVSGSGSTASTGVSGSGSTGSSSGSSSSGTKETAKEEAKNVGSTAKDAGRQVAGTAKEEAKNVAGEAKAQARQLLDQTMHEAREQTKSQQQRLAGGISTFGDDLRGMANGEGAQSGLAAQLVNEVSDRASAAGRWLEDREPADLLDEVTSFARRRPATFIAIAGVAGLLVGRLARGIVSEAKEEREQQSSGGSSAYGSGAYSGGGYGSSGTGSTAGAYGADTTGAYGGSSGTAHGAHAVGQPPVTQWNAPAAENATPEIVDSPYRDSTGGSTRGTIVDGDVPSQTGHSPSGTGQWPDREGGR